jgi:hypothetical protein
MKTFRSLLAFGILALVWAGCAKEESFEGDAYTLELRFNPSANGEALVFNKEYVNPLGEDYSVRTFKFYVSRISLLQDQLQPSATDASGIFLVDASSEASKTIRVSLNGQPFNKLAFQLGVDSALNVSGAQTGALDPLNGMFWTWNSGYIMAKLEGNSTRSAQLNNTMTYHIGGFKGDERTQRWIVLDLPQLQEWTLEKNSITTMVIDADIDQWFSSTHDLPIGVHSENMTPGPLSVQYADNYANLFRIETVLRRQ